MPLVKPVGELALEILVDRQRAVGRSRSGGAGAVLQDRVARGRQHRGLEREPEVVVGAEHQGRPAVDDDLARTEHTLDHGLARSGASRREHGAPSLDSFELVEQIHPVVRHTYSPIWPTAAASISPRSYRSFVAARRTLPLVVRATVPRGTSTTSSTSSPNRSTMRRRIASVSTSAGTVPPGSTTMTARSAFPPSTVPNATTRPRLMPARSSMPHSRSW